MATLTSPISPLPHSATSDDLETRLDEQIAHVRNEINKLRTQKQQLSRALLGSSKVQKQLNARKSKANATDSRDLQARLEKAINQENHDNDVKVHRLAFGITAFPYTDTAPERQTASGSNRMLGVRIDLHPTKAELLRSANRDREKREHQPRAGDEHGKEEADEETTSYIVLLRKLHYQNRTYLKPHQHNIPKHIDVEGYSEQYLSLPDALHSHEDSNTMEIDAQEEGSFQDDSGIDVTQDVLAQDEPSTGDTMNGANGNASVEGNGQDLHKFVQSVRDDLQSWHYRSMAIRNTQAQLDLPVRSSASASGQIEATTEMVGKYGVIKLEQITNDARQARIIWENGSLGLLRFAYEGHVEQAVVYGTVPEQDTASGDSAEQDGGTREEHVRLHDVERMLMRKEDGEKVPILNLEKRLKTITEKCFAD